MNIMYVCDDNYAMLLGVSLTSLYYNNQEESKLDVYIINDNISENNIEKLNSTAKRYGRKIIFINKPKMYNLLRCNPNTLKWCDNIFCRLYVVTLFEQYGEVNKIIYMDCDTIINRELHALWNIELDQNICAAGLECMGSLHKKLIGLDENCAYVNSGVLLIDIEKWKRNDIEKKCTQFLLQNLDCLEYPDEGILNGVLKEKIYILPAKYNLTTLKCTFTYEELQMYRKSKVMYERNEYNEAVLSPCIIHYTANFLVRRPWIRGRLYSHYFHETFIRYKSISEWKESQLFDSKEGIDKVIARKLSIHFRKIIIFCCGFLYSYIKPLKYFCKK